jgi:hypothetical protein
MRRLCGLSVCNVGVTGGLAACDLACGAPWRGLCGKTSPATAGLPSTMTANNARGVRARAPRPTVLSAVNPCTRPVPCPSIGPGDHGVHPRCIRECITASRSLLTLCILIAITLVVGGMPVSVVVMRDICIVMMMVLMHIVMICLVAPVTPRITAMMAPWIVVILVISVVVHPVHVLIVVWHAVATVMLEIVSVALSFLFL